MPQVTIPRLFFEDHEARGLPTPDVVRFGGRKVVVSSTDPAIPALLDDARFYADPMGPSEAGGLRSSARATVRALESIPYVYRGEFSGPPESTCPNCGPRVAPILPCPTCATYGAHDGPCEHGLALDLWEDYLRMVDAEEISPTPCDAPAGVLGDGSEMYCALPAGHDRGQEDERHLSIEHRIASYRAEVAAGPTEEEIAEINRRAREIVRNRTGRRMPSGVDQHGGRS